MHNQTSCHGEESEINAPGKLWSSVQKRNLRFIAWPIWVMRELGRLYTDHISHWVRESCFHSFLDCHREGKVSFHCLWTSLRSQSSDRGCTRDVGDTLTLAIPPSQSHGGTISTFSHELSTPILSCVNYSLYVWVMFLSFLSCSIDRFAISEQSTHCILSHSWNR